MSRAAKSVARQIDRLFETGHLVSRANGIWLLRRDSAEEIGLMCFIPDRFALPGHLRQHTGI